MTPYLENRLPHLVRAQVTMFHFPQVENSTCALALPLPTKAIRLCGVPIMDWLRNDREGTIPGSQGNNHRHVGARCPRRLAARNDNEEVVKKAGTAICSSRQVGKIGFVFQAEDLRRLVLPIFIATFR